LRKGVEVRTAVGELDFGPLRLEDPKWERKR
jgi:hypothetical protein